MVRAIGLEPVVHGTPGGEWVVAVEGGHVRATAVYEYRNGQTKRAGGELTVDGVSRPVVNSMAELRTLWDKHEARDAVMPELVEVVGAAGRPVPFPVRMIAEQAEKMARGKGIPVSCGLWDGHWVIALDLENGNGLRLIFTRHGHEWSLDRHRPLQLVIGGEDKSADAMRQPDRAMAMLAASYSRDGVSGTAKVSAQAGFRNSGVETRGRVVIRELTKKAPAAAHGG